MQITFERKTIAPQHRSIIEINIECADKQRNNEATNGNPNQSLPGLCEGGEMFPAKFYNHAICFPQDHGFLPLKEDK